MRFFFALLMLLCAVAGATAHDHWVIANLPEAAGAQVTVRICSGHRFPDGETLLARRLLADTAITRDGEAVPFDPKADGTAWNSELSFPEPGVWIISFSLRRPQDGRLMHVGRHLAIVGDGDDLERYSTGVGLEIVPAAMLSRLKPGDTLPLSILMDGVPVEGRINIVSARGPSSNLSTTPDRPAQLALGNVGAYLLTASRGGTTFSLTFHVTQPETGKTQ